MLNKYKIYDQIKNLGFDPNVIVDCGAGWGDWIGKISPIFPNSFSISIDANPWTGGKINSSDVTEIVVLSDEDDKEMTFYRKKEMLDQGTFCTGDSLFKENTHHYQSINTLEEKVSTKTLKTIINKYDKSNIDLLKIDTQGSELIIMKGLGNALEDVEFIELECSVLEYNLGGCNFFDIISFLNDKFEIFDILELHYHNNFLAHIDILFKNKKSTIKKI